jgi:hypothetical protein
VIRITHEASSPMWQAAMKRATKQYQAGVRAERIGDRTYRVPSARNAGVVYTVQVLNPTTLQASCNCPHGSLASAPHCYHVALALCSAIERVSPAARPARDAAANDRAVARLFVRS